MGESWTEQRPLPQTALGLDKWGLIVDVCLLDLFTRSQFEQHFVFYIVCNAREVTRFYNWPVNCIL